MAINERLIDTAVSGCSAEPPEEGLQLHLDANDVDSYDGDGDIWYDITDHEYTPATNVSEHFNTVLHPGNSIGTTKQITGVGFQPDLVITQARNASPSQINSVYDSVRGVGNGVDSAGERMLATSLTIGQSGFDGRVNGYLSSFDLDGFTATKGTGAGQYYYNHSGYNYVSWCFKAGGAAVLNEEGTIDSQVSANNDLGFSIVKYTGNGSSNEEAIGHGLDVKPEMVIIKDLDNVRDWYVYTDIIDGSMDVLYLNKTDAKANSSRTSPTSSVYKIQGATTLNKSSQNFISYCFTSKRGVSKVGSFVGTGVAGNKVYTGFEPAFIMIKRTSSTGGWTIVDNKRTPLNKYLSANSNATETSATSPIVFENDGFSFGGTGVSFNQSGVTAIYYAVAKNTNETSLIPDTDLELNLDADSFPEKGESGYNNTPSTWTDSSSNSNNGTITGATFDSELGNWLDFDGSNDFVDLGDINGTNTGLTVSTWVNPDSTQLQYATIFDFEHSDDEGWAMHQDNNTTNSYKIALKDGVAWDVSDGFSLTANTWHHIAFTVNSGGAFELYVNGSNTQSKSGWGGLGSQQRRLNLGCWGSTDGVNRSRFWNGQIGQFRIYSSALTQAQIRQNYNFTKPSYPNGHNFIGNNMDSADWNTNGYFSFNGTNELFSDTSFTPSLTDVQTVSYWVRNSAISGNETVFSIGQTGASNVYSWINFGYSSTAGAVQASYSDTVGDIKNGTKTNSAYISSDWQHHCFLIFPENRGTSSQAFKIYIDGVESAVTNSTTSNSLATVQGYPIIGRYSGQVVNQFSGDLSSLRVYDRRLTEAEITALHCKGR